MTQLYHADPDSIRHCADLILEGKLVAFPTETVYGLGANGMDPDAVRSIFAAKDRPADNPLIYHIHSLSQWSGLVTDIPDAAAALAEAFWPGPMTIILPAKPCVPEVGRAGLATVGVRMPDHPVAAAFLAACGVPVAAPSANRSGRPSPTRAEDVMKDMDGRIPAVLDGGPCRIGLESTVLSVEIDRVRILRPGGVTREMLEAVVPHVEVHVSALSPMAAGSSAPSPGMLHRHYAPKARVLLASGSARDQAEKICSAYDACSENCMILGTEENLPIYGKRKVLTWGTRTDPGTLAETLFTLLREADRQGASVLFAETVEPVGLGLAVMNRLLRAAEFRYLGDTV